MDTTNILRRSGINISTECYENMRMFRVRCDIANRTTMNSLREAVKSALDSGLHSIVISFTADSYLFSEIIPHLIKINAMAEGSGAVLYLVENDPQLRTILDRIGISRIVHVVGSCSEVPLGARLP